MTATAVSGRQILLRLAPEMGEYRGMRITGVVNSAAITLSMPTSSVTNEYQWAWIRIFGKGIGQIQTQNSSGGVVVSPAFTSTPVVGETAGLALWNANKEENALAAINDFIGALFPQWFREVILDKNNTTLSDGTTSYALAELSADTDEYLLPSDMAILSRIGIQPAADVPWSVVQPPLDLWRVIGTEGNKKIKFYRNGRTFLPAAWAGEELCLHYMAREPLLTNLNTASCQVPLDVFVGAAEYFKRRWLWRDGRTDLATDNVALPQLQMAAAAALARAGAVRPMLETGPETGWRLG